MSNFSTHYDELASLPFIEGYVANDHAQTLLDELFFQRAVQTYFFPGNAPFTSDSFNFIDSRTAFFTYAYSASPGMAVNTENIGAKYPATVVDADGDFLNGISSTQLWWLID